MSPGPNRSITASSHPVFSVRVIAAWMACVAIVGMLMVQGVELELSARRTIGVTMESLPNHGGAVLRSVGPGPAKRAGLVNGDVIIEVNQVKVASVDDYDRAASRFARGPAQFSIDRAGRHLELRVDPGVSFPWGSFLENALVVFSFLLIAILTILQVSDLRGRLLLLFLLAVAFEFALPEALVGAPRLSIAVNALFLLVSGVQMALELHLASVIPVTQPWLLRHRWVVGLYYLVGVGSGLALFVTYLGEATGLGSFAWTSAQAQSFFFNVAFPVWALAVPALLAIPALRYPEPQGRYQAGLVLAGVLPWTATVVIATGHQLAGQPPPPWLDTIEPFILLFYPAALFLAIFRYQLFDMELVFRRSLLYTVLTTVLLLVFYGALGAGGVLFSELIHGNQVWVVAGATLILGLLFTPLRRGLENVIYRRFFPERLALRQRLTALASELPALGKLPLMGERLVNRLCDVLGVRWATLFIADPHTGLLASLSSTLGNLEESLEHSLLLSPQDPGLRLLTTSGRPFAARQLAAKSPLLGQRLDALKASVAVPLLNQDKLIGLLLLGPKEDNDKYPAEELELLNFLAHHVAVVLENARLFESATRDSLTGLWRREAILERLDSELQRALRYDRPLSIGLADLDHFKGINDRYGHLTGDSMLKWVSHVLLHGLRSTDHVGRYGGEEFLVVLPETELAGAITVAEKARALVEDERLVIDGGEQVGITISIGLASLESFAHKPVTIKELIAAADRSLYQAKAAGRNQVRPSVA